jgi:hypothetical protein
VCYLSEESVESGVKALLSRVPSQSHTRNVLEVVFEDGPGIHSCRFVAIQETRASDVGCIREAKQRAGPLGRLILISYMFQPNSLRCQATVASAMMEAAISKKPEA